MIGADIAERAAVLEYGGGLSRADTEAQAVREIYAERLDDGIQTPGILGELIVAARQRYHPTIAAECEAQGLDRTRVTWGFDWAVSDGAAYRPADGGEQAHSAVIVPAIVDGCIVDLVAQFLDSGSLTRLGVACIVGADDVELARSTGQPLYIFSSPLAWLRGGARGAVIVDWQHVGHEIDGVPTILCSPSIAARLFSSTRECFPAPDIAIPPKAESYLAAA